MKYSITKTAPATVCYEFEVEANSREEALLLAPGIFDSLDIPDSDWDLYDIEDGDYELEDEDEDE